MSIKKATKATLLPLRQVISEIDLESYRTPIPKLGSSSIGQHVRHILEFYQCLLIGCKGAAINYDNRERDYLLETEPSLAMEEIDEIIRQIEEADENMKLVLSVCYSLEDNISSTVESNFKRELIYNIEHAIHHMAIIKIGIRELKLEQEIPEGFGVAVSTLKYRQSFN